MGLASEVVLDRVCTKPVSRALLVCKDRKYFVLRNHASVPLRADSP